MYKQRSSSNEILNCRTIDDAVVDNWFRAALDERLHSTSEVSSDQRSSDNREIFSTEIDHTQSKGNGFSQSVAQGFETALTLERINTTSVEQLRQRAFYKSDYAPKVFLQVSIVIMFHVVIEPLKFKFMGVYGPTCRPIIIQDKTVDGATTDYRS